MTKSFRTRITCTVVALATLVLLGPAAKAQVGVRPLSADEFAQSPPRGFNDRQNSWAQAMAWWKDALYVGTSRASLCSSLVSVHRLGVFLLGQAFADAFLPYPTNDPDLSCAPEAADLPLQAEIWRWSPASDWQRVFQSPLDLDNPGTGPPAPPVTGKKLPYEISFRGMAAHKESGGVEALYAFGVNGTVLWDRAQLPPPRILRSVDGFNFVPIPQAPGTFLGDLPFNPDHSSFRSPVSFGGKLFVLCGPIFGQGSLIASADPAQGNNAWFLAAPTSLVFYEMASFNGWLYLGTLDSQNGYSIVKTKAEGPPPYQFITVVPPGAYLPVLPSKSVVSMEVYQNRLYVGTASQTELIRINPDDTWDLLVGFPRLVPNSTEIKYPLSGLDAGWGHSLNDHAWQMESAYGSLYIGTFNAATGAKDDPVNGPKVAHIMGAHLYRTFDGWYYSAVTTNGFSNPQDPYGGKFDFGIRTMANTPYGFFVGTTNDHYGLAVFRGKPVSPGKFPAPNRLEIEPTNTGKALLSWAAATDVKRYEVWRAERGIVLIRDDFNFENWNGVTGNKFPDTYIGPYKLIGTTTQTNFIDETVDPAKRYMYYVVVETNTKGKSDQSNLVGFPLLVPPMSFFQLDQEVVKLNQRGRFVSATYFQNMRQAVLTAGAQAASCNLNGAINTLKSQNPFTAVRSPESYDLEIEVAKLMRRIGLEAALPLNVMPNEFCVIP